ncbi:hypothetical protein LOC67_04775 [Stieleria sp. JC731]|uniref:hypothetical protein n=1 Tax=Pirellulaceae TaxID=2691357 RepID=UPI001E5FDE23|nr:hypothetical protein [Stieleria sp. JC731]MCC9599868.1 hypothetical protein [Stieleria sp. JC731]
MKASLWFCMGVVLLPVLFAAGCGSSGEDTTYLPVAPPTPEERAEAEAYTEQMLKPPGQ